MNWLALGIESGRQSVRLEVTKGRFRDVDIKEVVRLIEASGIEIIANYLFGLPGDDYESMQETLDLSVELCTGAWNGYAVMALPGSELFREAINKGYSLPPDYSGYSFHSYDTLPLPTKYLTAAQVLEFRDNAFLTYHTNPQFLRKVKQRFGDGPAQNIRDLNKIRLKRKLLEEKP